LIIFKLESGDKNNLEAQFYIPCKLDGLANAIWEQKSDAPSGWQILPSGFVELIFNLGPPMHDLQGKRVGGDFNPTENFCFLSGLHTKPLVMSYARFHVMGVQLYPLAVKALFRLPCNEVRDWALSSGQIFENVAELEETLRSISDFNARARWLENYLQAMISESPELHTAFRIKSTILKAKQLLQTGKRVKIEDLTGYSRMHTHKLFNDWFGLAPSRALRLSQFVHALHLIHNSPLKLTDIGHESGFYDQAHFIRVFREFSSMSPGSYKKHKSDIIGQF
jgi:AraC-like DNA-binding protein